jgi:5-oxoprolinase (ATP-hydrolysing)
MSAAILSTRRETEPFGLAGGQPGEKGRNTLIRKDDTRVMLRGCDEVDVAPGDAIEISTPGGGGFGKDLS